MTHSKQKGNLGFSSTIKELHKLGVNVFVELGDNSKTDLIVEINGKLIKFQVKYANEKNGYATLKLQKAGPNGYRYTYLSTDVDIFSVYLPKLDKVIFIPSKLACQNKVSFAVRLEKTKNNQSLNVNTLDKFENLSKILSDALEA